MSDPRKCPFCGEQIYPSRGVLDQSGATRVPTTRWACNDRCGYVRLDAAAPMQKLSSGYWWEVDPAYIDALRKEREAERKRDAERPRLELPVPERSGEKKIDDAPVPGSTVIVVDI